MDQSIVPVAMIQAKARADFARGVGREDHGFNWHCTAVITTWQHEWDLCAATTWGLLLDQRLAAETPP